MLLDEFYAWKMVLIALPKRKVTLKMSSSELITGRL